MLYLFILLYNTKILHYLSTVHDIYIEAKQTYIYIKEKGMVVLRLVSLFSLFSFEKPLTYSQEKLYCVVDCISEIIIELNNISNIHIFIVLSALFFIIYSYKKKL